MTYSDLSTDILVLSIMLSALTLTLSLLHHYLTERHVRRQWSSLYGHSGFSPRWRGQNGLYYHYDLSRHKIVRWRF